jgi:hypothetical protein
MSASGFFVSANDPFDFCTKAPSNRQAEQRTAT